MKAAGSESISSAPCCRWLRAVYYAAKARESSTRARRDEVLIPQLIELWEANYRVYGVL